MFGRILNLKMLILLVATLSSFSLQAAVQCSATVGSFLGDWSELIHNLLIIPPAMGIIHTFLDGESTGWKEKIKSTITYGFLIWACVADFMSTIFGWFGC